MFDIRTPFSAKEGRAVAAVLIATLIATLAVLAVPSVDAADGDTYDGEMTLYGYNVVMGLKNPSQVESVTWDFGDGSEPVTVEITATNANGEVKHLFEKEGDYVVTATAHNTYTDESGQHDGAYTETYLFHIKGFPTITFDSQGGSEVQPVEGTRSQFVASQPAAPTKDGFAFGGWFTDSDCTQPYDWSSTVVRDITLYAKWVEETVEFTVTFDMNGGDGSLDPLTIKSGETITEPANPSRTGYVFMGWQFNGQLWSFTSPVTSDMTLVAVWEPVGSETVYHVVTFDANGGTAGQTQLNVLEGNSVVLPTATRDGYTFDGWYSGETFIGNAGDSYKVVSNITLTAHWTEIADDDSDLWMYVMIAGIVLTIIFAFVTWYTGIIYVAIPTVISAIVAIVAALLWQGVI
ncbi:MAG: hypothetical protein A3205_05745 [Methanomassiliicoccales archaeon Mx-03]|nr:MAG: hypothetical protein A3205_05745 [Methanomassiliicoccales archaeon Mx-03]